MNARCFHIALIWMAAVVPLGFADSFPSRPTAAEMDEAVVAGIVGDTNRCQT